MVRLTLAVLVGLSLSAGLVEAQGSSRWQQQISTQLTRYTDALSRQGYARSHEIKNGSLDDDESEAFTLELDGGHSYALIGVCDEDCTDVDLRLYDADGREVDSDIEVDDYPVLEVSPTRTATYRVKVIMATCSTSPCFYGVGVFSR